MTHTYNITGMTCNACVAKVRTELLKLPDVTSAEVQLDTPQATITMQKHISMATLQAAIARAGAKYTITEADADMHHAMAADSPDKANSYLPIFLIFGYITGVTLLGQVAQGEFMLMQWMRHFMAGFFFVFSFFKIMNLKGFAEGYGTYDIVAKAVPAYGYIYPFLELALGIAFITGWEPLITNIVTLVVMGVSTIGVAQSLLNKKPFQCACLGTVIKLPLSKVTLFEDLLMVGMSIMMILKLI